MFGPVTNIIIYEFTTNVVNSTFRKLDFIATCFKCGFHQEQIISILSLRPNVLTNLRTMHRILKKLDLKRSNNNIDMREIIP